MMGFRILLPHILSLILCFPFNYSFCEGRCGETMAVRMNMPVPVSDDIRVIIKAPERAASGKVFETQVTVHKNDLGGFARMTIELPPSTQSAPVDVLDGNFSVQNNELKIIWMELPAGKEFTVRFSLVISGEPGSQAWLKGHFAYVVGNERKLVPITPVDIQISEDPDTDTKAKESIAVRSEKKPEEENKTSPSPSNGDGVMFSVQIASSPVKYNASYFKEKYHLSDPVNMELVSGSYKYLVGSFSDYENAAKLKNKLSEHHHLAGVFIVSYKNGKRIPVSEALQQKKKNDQPAK